MFIRILSKVSILFIALLIGGIARHKRILTEESTRSLAQVVIVVTLPLLYFYSLATRMTLDIIRTVWVLPIFAVCLVLMAYALAKLASRFVALNNPQKTTFVYLTTFTNCGFLAIPIAHALYGTDGIVRAVFFNVGFNLLFWTLGVWTLKSSGGNAEKNSANVSPWRNLLNSGTVGLLCGITAGLFALRIPSSILGSAQLVGSATIPLALLVVGSIMYTGGARRLREYKRELAVIVVIRLVIVPAIALLATGFMSTLSPLVRAIIVLQAAMPSASTAPIFTTRYGGDCHFASAGVFATTACSVITVPIFLSLL